MAKMEYDVRKLLKKNIFEVVPKNSLCDVQIDILFESILCECVNGFICLLINMERKVGSRI